MEQWLGPERGWLWPGNGGRRDPGQHNTKRTTRHDECARDGWVISTPASWRFWVHSPGWGLGSVLSPQMSPGSLARVVLWTGLGPQDRTLWSPATLPPSSQGGDETGHHGDSNARGCCRLCSLEVGGRCRAPLTPGPTPGPACKTGPSGPAAGLGCRSLPPVPGPGPAPWRSPSRTAGGGR